MSVQTDDLISFLRGLRAVREYTQEPVDDRVIAGMLEVGRWSGSASNRQPAEVVVVRDRSLMQKFVEGGVRAAAGASLALVIVTPGDTDRRELEIFDDGRLVERLLLAARAYGLGSNVSTLKGDGPAVIKRALGIPAERRIWTVVTIGHIDQEARKARPARPGPARKPATAFAHWDRY
jgi:nitroreductase